MQGISVENLSCSYGTHLVLRDVSFALSEREVLSVLGPNGSGKSTLFKCILGALTPTEGSITVDGEAVAGMQESVLAERIAYIPQSTRPAFGYTVLDIVLMGMIRKMKVFSQPTRAQEEEARSVLSSLGMEGLAERSFGKISGGEQQLVLIARALAQGARYILMDEPTSALDYGNQARVLDRVRALAGSGYGVLISTHNPQHALNYADRMIALKNGGILAEGRPEEVMEEGLIKALYGVEARLVETDSGRAVVPVMTYEDQQTGGV